MFAQPLFATEQQPQQGPPAGKQPGLFDNPMSMITFFLVPALLFWFIIMRPARKQDQERKLAQNSLKKNDEVITYCGILGTVVGIKEKGPDGAATQDDEITLRVEGAKIRFIRSAIARVITKGEENKDAENGNKTT